MSNDAMLEQLRAEMEDDPIMHQQREKRRRNLIVGLCNKFGENALYERMVDHVLDQMHAEDLQHCLAESKKQRTLGTVEHAAALLPGELERRWMDSKQVLVQGNWYHALPTEQDTTMLDDYQFKLVVEHLSATAPDTKTSALAVYRHMLLPKAKSIRVAHSMGLTPCARCTIVGQLNDINWPGATLAHRALLVAIHFGLLEPASRTGVIPPALVQMSAYDLPAPIQRSLGSHCIDFAAAQRCVRGMAPGKMYTVNNNYDIYITPPFAEKIELQVVRIPKAFNATIFDKLTELHLNNVKFRAADVSTLIEFIEAGLTSLVVFIRAGTCGLRYFLQLLRVGRLANPRPRLETFGIEIAAWVPQAVTAHDELGDALCYAGQTVFSNLKSLNYIASGRLNTWSFIRLVCEPQQLDSSGKLPRFPELESMHLSLSDKEESFEQFTPPTPGSRALSAQIRELGLLSSDASMATLGAIFRASRWDALCHLELDGFDQLEQREAAKFAGVVLPSLARLTVKRADAANERFAPALAALMNACPVLKSVALDISFITLYDIAQTWCID